MAVGWRSNGLGASAGPLLHRWRGGGADVEGRWAGGGGWRWARGRQNFKILRLGGGLNCRNRFELRAKGMNCRDGFELRAKGMNCRDGFELRAKGMNRRDGHGEWKEEEEEEEEEEGWVWSEEATPYQILGIDPSCSPSEFKSAFRSRVKEFHPDICKNNRHSETIIRRIIQAYEMLSKYYKLQDQGGLDLYRESSDPFENPECEAFDIFVNEVVCMGKACPYPCVKTAPHVFSFSSTGAARAMSHGVMEDYQVQLAVGQCPRKCIHYVTPYQRSMLEELIQGILNSPYDEAEVAYLEALIAKASMQNNMYQKPKRGQPKSATEYADFF
ncbi:chaperone DnaJ-domain superfamily protein [Wolffia australiana]